MKMQDGLYEKVRKKRLELESLTRELGQAAASLRDHEALVRERAAQHRELLASIELQEQRRTS
jgi:hypothetical protein